MGSVMKPIAKVLGLNTKITPIQSATKAAEDVVEVSAEEAAKKKKALLAQNGLSYGTSGGQLGQEFTGGASGRSTIFNN